jgi:hypothetical protein
MALFWMVAVVLVRGESGVPEWWLPVALGLGFIVPAPRVPGAAGGPATGWWRRVAALVLFVALVAVGYGALATPSRHWDGAAAFDAKVFWLSREATLQQPFFADPAVFHHSPDYPLLLPLLVAMTERLLGGGLGRLWLPGVYVLWLLVLAAALVRAGCERRVALAIVVAAALTPALLGPGSGAVDSGYSEPVLLLATTTIAAGLLLASPVDLAVGVVLALASKPEGIAYAMVAAWVAFVRGQRHLLLVVLAAFALGCTLWLPTQRQLLHEPAVGTWGLLAVVLGALSVLAAAGIGIDALAERSSMAERWRYVVGFAAIAAVPLMLPLLASAVPPTSALGIYLHRGTGWCQGVAHLPAIAGAFAEHGLLRVQFGSTYLLALLLLAWRPGAAMSTTPAARTAATFFGLGLLTTALPFVLTHEEMVQHHLRSSMPRLLLHWLGPAWLFIGCRLSPLLATTRAGATTPAGPS